MGAPDRAIHVLLMAAAILQGCAFSRLVEIRPGVQVKIERAEHLEEQGKHEAARDAYRELAEGGFATEYERGAVVSRLALAEVAAGDTAAARSAFAEALRIERLPPGMRQRLLFVHGQLLIQEERWDDGVALLEEWLASTAVEEPDPDRRAERAHAHIVAGYTLYRMEEPGRALEHVEAAVRLRPDHPQGWGDLLLALYLKRERYAEAEALLFRVLEDGWDDANAWMQLAGVYMRQGSEEDALAVLLLAYRAAALGSDDLLGIVQLQGRIGWPDKAARLLADWRARDLLPENRETFELEADCWLLAREYEPAIATLREGAAKLGDGELFRRSGDLNFDRARWREAVHAYGEALERGDLRRPSHARLKLGIAAFRADLLHLSETSLRQAREDPELAEEAQRWLDRVLERRRTGAGSG